MAGKLIAAFVLLGIGACEACSSLQLICQCRWQLSLFIPQGGRHSQQFRLIGPGPGPADGVGSSSAKRGSTMLKGLTVLFFVQWLGTAVGLLAVPMLPGPILGMLLLLGWLMARGEISQPIDTAASGLLQYLPLLLVVPAVGIIDSGDLLLDDLPIIATALVLSLLVTVPLCGWLMQRMINRAESRGERRP